MRHFIIPARGGSKTVPDKNLQQVGGHTLLRWTVECARAVANREAGDQVVVNTDDDKIADIASGFAVEVYRRPAHLGSDHATMLDVVKNHVKDREAIDDVVLLYPTCPFRRPETLRTALSIYEARRPHVGGGSLMSVVECKSRPYGGVQIIDGGLGYAQEAEAFYRKQDTPPLYYATGAIFIMGRHAIPNLNNQLFGKDTIPFVMGAFEGLDIDTESDLAMARALAQADLTWRPAINEQKLAASDFNTQGMRFA